MRHEEATLLREQLTQALAGADEPGELASLAGLLQRLHPDDPLLGEVHARLRGVELHFDEPAAQALEQLCAVDEEDDAAESWDALCALDELSAAATFLGRPAELGDTVQSAAHTLRAFPEPWGEHAALATELLQDRAPLPQDPAWVLWAAVEASRWLHGVQSEEGEEEISPRVRWSLALPQRAQIPTLRLAASTSLPEDPPWIPLYAGAGWELALTSGEAGQPVILASVPFEAQHEGQPVDVVQGSVGWSCDARAGSWTVAVRGELRTLELTL